MHIEEKTSLMVLCHFYSDIEERKCKINSGKEKGEWIVLLFLYVCAVLLSTSIWKGRFSWLSHIYPLLSFCFFLFSCHGNDIAHEEQVSFSSFGRYNGSSWFTDLSPFKIFTWDGFGTGPPSPQVGSSRRVVETLSYHLGWQTMLWPCLGP